MPTRIIRRTKAEPQAVRGGKAALPGFEPGTSWSRTKRYCQIELEGIEVRETRVERARRLLLRESGLPDCHHSRVRRENFEIPAR